MKLWFYFQKKFTEYAIGFNESQQIETLTEGALMALAHYTLQQMQWTRYGKLLLALRDLSLRNYDGVLQNLFNNIINEILRDNDLNLTGINWIK